MKTMYKVWFSIALIEPTEIVSETGKTVMTKRGRRENKVGGNYAWLYTYEEAYKSLTEYAHARITAAEVAQRQAQTFAEKVAALAPEKPSNA